MGIIDRIKNAIKMITNPEDYIAEESVRESRKSGEPENLYKDALREANAGSAEDKAFIETVKMFQKAGYNFRTAVERAMIAEDQGKSKENAKLNLLCPECKKEFGNINEFKSHWNKEHGTMTSLKKAYKEVVHENIPSLIPESIEKNIPSPVKEAAKKSLGISEKALPSIAGGVKKVGSSDRTNVTCRYCGTSYPYEEDSCPNPDCPYLLENGERAPNPHQDPFRKKMLEKDKKSLKSSAGKRVGARIYEVFIFEIAGIASMFIPSILAFPYSFVYLAIALMVFMPAYILLPSEYDILKSIGPDENLGQGKAALLFPKAGAKIFAFAFILFQFSMINMLVTLVLAFIFYFSLPLRYRTSRPYEMIESWARMGLGLYIAILFLMVFGTTTSVGSSLALMAAAFFFTLPVHSEEKEEGAFVVVVSDKIKRVLDSPIERYVIFPILMIGALFTSGIILGWTGSIAQIMFIAVWFLSFITGISAGPEGRPAIGILMIFIALFAFTSMYTGVIGQAVFGYWWPQIQSFGDTYLSPLNTAWSQAQSSLGDAWLLITNPQQYYLNAEIKSRATKSVITPGGKPVSIEVEKFELTPSIPGTLEPSEPVVGIMELHNQGDFISGSMDLKIWSAWVNATTSQETSVGSVTDLYCSNATPTNGNLATCIWNGITYPTEMRSVTFILQDGNAWNAGGVNIYSDCTDNSGPTPVPCDCWGGGCPYGNTTYTYSGTTVKVSTNLTYDYVVNVSLPINIINSAVYLNKLEAGDIVLQDLTSEYTGGPIKATLFSPKQPARTDIPFLIQASIYNDGQGELLSIKNFTITVYGVGDSIDWVQLIGDDFRISKPSGSQPDGCGPYPNPQTPSSMTPADGKHVITCNYGYAGSVIKPGEYRRVSLYIKPKEGNIIDQKTTLIVGTATYTYRKTNTQTLTVANAPPQ
jgi:hypothetical protein